MNELPDSPQGVMNLLPNTSQQITTFANGVINAVKDGNENPLNVMLQIRAMEKAFETIKNSIKENVIREADKYPGTTFIFRGERARQGRRENRIRLYGMQRHRMGTVEGRRRHCQGKAIRTGNVFKGPQRPAHGGGPVDRGSRNDSTPAKEINTRG